MRNTLNPPGSPLRAVDDGDAHTTFPHSPVPPTPSSRTRGKYDGIEDKARLERLIKAKEKTKSSLEGKAGWMAMNQAKAEDQAAAAAAEGVGPS